MINNKKGAIIRNPDRPRVRKFARPQKHISNIIPATNIGILLNKNNIIMDKRIPDRIGIDSAAYKREDKKNAKSGTKEFLHTRMLWK